MLINAIVSIRPFLSQLRYMPTAVLKFE